MSTMATESEHLDAVLALLNDSGAVPYTVQTANRVAVLPPAYSVVTIEPRAGGAFRSGRTNTRGYRLAIQARGQTEDKAQQVREAADMALRGAALTVNNRSTTPLALEGGQPVDDDANPGWYSGLLLYTYVY